MSSVELSCGPVEYGDTGGDGPTLVMLHGLMMNASLWTQTVADLAPEYRCVTPTLPMGAHEDPVAPGTDLSLPGLASIVHELLNRLDLRDVTLVAVDTGGAIAQLLMAAGEGRVGRVVLIACEAFDNLPPGTTGRTLALSAKLSPALFGLFMQQLRLGPVRRSPMAFGHLTKRGDRTTRQWLGPVLSRPDVRRDTVRLLRATFADRRLLEATADRLPSFDRPVLIVWPTEDKVMPVEHGRRLKELLPQARLVEVEDSYTLVPLDQPAQLGGLVRRFVTVARTA